MKIEVLLRKEEDPHIYDADTNVSLRKRCASLTVTFTPGRHAKATLVLYKHGPDGLPYVEGEGDEERIATETVEADLKCLHGDWTAA